MKLPIEEIQIKEGRRELNVEHVEELLGSIRELGLLNPLTVDKDHILIAGLHRLEAVKRLGWSEVEVTVCSLEGLQAELAEIDENIIRSDLSALEYGEILLRRKEIYETLHPETKAGVSQAAGMNRAIGRDVSDKMTLTSKSFVEDTAEKLGVGKRTVERQIQTAKNLTPEAKEIIRDSDTKITKKAALKLSRLKPEQQKEAAKMLAEKKIKSVEEYRIESGKVSGTSIEGPTAEFPAVENPPQKESNEAQEAPAPALPFTLDTGKRFATFKESVADLKNPDKDCSCTPDIFLAEFTGFVRKFLREMEWYATPHYAAVYPDLTQQQLHYLRQQADSLCAAAQNLIEQIERKKEL